MFRVPFEIGKIFGRHLDALTLFNIQYIQQNKAKYFYYTFELINFYSLTFRFKRKFGEIIKRPLDDSISKIPNFLFSHTYFLALTVNFLIK